MNKGKYTNFRQGVIQVVWLILLLMLITAIFSNLTSAETSAELIKDGNLFYEQGDYNSAIEAYDKAIAIDPDHPYAWRNKGNALAGLSQYEDAIEAYDKAIAIDPNHTYAKNNRENALDAVKANKDTPIDLCFVLLIILIIVLVLLFSIPLLLNRGKTWNTDLSIAIIVLIGILMLRFLEYKWDQILGPVILAVIGYVILKLTIFEKMGWVKSKQKEKLEQQLKSYIHEHNQKLIDTVIKPWYEDKSVNPANEPFATEHLQTGYTDILKLRQECKTIKDALSSEENTINEYIKNKLAPDVPHFGFSRDFTVEDIEMQIYKIMESASKKGEILDNYRAHLSLFGYRVEDHNEKYIVDKKEIFRKRIESIIKDKTLYEKFETINKNRKISHKKIHEFYQGLKQIEHDFEERHIELKGTCKDCRDWHGELKSLK